MGGVLVKWAYFYHDPYPADNYGNIEPEKDPHGSKFIQFYPKMKYPYKPSRYMEWQIRMTDVSIL